MGRLADECNARHEWTSGRVFTMKPDKFGSNETDNVVLGRVGAVDLDMCPADDIEFDAVNCGYLAVHYSDDDGPLRPGFTYRAALDISREDDKWLGTDDLELVDMPECPILIVPRTKVLKAARSIVGMALPAGERRVENADVEGVVLCGGVSKDEVVRDGGH